MTTRFASAKVTAAFATLLAGLSLVAGCGTANRTVPIGTSSGGISRSAKGSVTLSLKWPDRPVKVASRLIPIAANAVTVSLTRYEQGLAVTQVPAQTATLTRGTTPAGSTATYTFTNLELGQYVVTALAYPDAAAAGVPQAAGPTSGALGSGNAMVTVTTTPTPLNITMFSTVKSVVLTPSTDQVLRLGQKETIVATALDASGNTVITATPTTFTTTGKSPFTYKVLSGGTYITVTPDTPGATAINSATVQASATVSGSAVVTATYAETGAVATLADSTSVDSSVSVTSSPLNFTVTQVGLSSSAAPKFHFDAGNTGQATSGGVVTGASKNSLVVGDHIVYGSPSINAAGDTLFIGAEDGNLYAVGINPAGVVGTTPKWSYPTGGPIEGAPLIDVNGTVYIGSTDGFMYAIKPVAATVASGTAPAIPAHGQLVWKFNAGAEITGSANIDKNGTLYFATEAFNLAGTTTTSTVFFVDSLSGLAIKNSAGTALAFTGDTSGFSTTPALNAAQDTIYLGAKSGTLYAVSTTSGLVRAQYPLGDSIDHSSSVVATTTADGLEKVYQATTGGKLFALRAAGINDGPLGAFITYNATGEILATPAFSTTNQVLVVATYDQSSGQNDSRIAVVDANNGTEIARTTPILNSFADAPSLTPAELSQAASFLFASSPAISADGSTAYVGSEDGHLYSVDITGLASGTGATGTYLTITSLLETQGNSQINPILIDSSPTIDANGHVYIGGYDGSVYAVTQ